MDLCETLIILCKVHVSYVSTWNTYEQINRVIAERVWKEREQQPKREYKVDGSKFMALGLRLNK